MKRKVRMKDVHKILTHKQPIRGENWQSPQFATLNTKRGYFKENEIAYDGDNEVFTVYAGASVTSSTAHFIAKRQAADRAIIVHHGEIVVIEGALYEVQFHADDIDSPRHSNPIEFAPLDIDCEERDDKLLSSIYVWCRDYLAMDSEAAWEAADAAVENAHKRVAQEAIDAHKRDMEDAERDMGEL